MRIFVSLSNVLFIEMIMINKYAQNFGEIIRCR